METNNDMPAKPTENEQGRHNKKMWKKLLKKGIYAEGIEFKLPEKPIKLTPKQKEVIKLIRNGYKCEDVVTNSESAFLHKNGRKIPVRIATINKLVLNNLLYERPTNFAVTHFHLTKEGTEINID